MWPHAQVSYVASLLEVGRWAGGSSHRTCHQGCTGPPLPARYLLLLRLAMHVLEDDGWLIVRFVSAKLAKHALAGQPAAVRCLHLSPDRSVAAAVT